ncbi:Dynamin related protein 4A [Perilla frutescens var. hirtella]|nr:Dynamin related protein 4A [Perilla frutescens var. hirtella]
MVEDLGKNFESTGNWKMWYRERSCPASWEDLNIVEKKFLAFDPCGQGSQNGKDRILIQQRTPKIYYYYRSRKSNKEMVKIVGIATVHIQSHLSSDVADDTLLKELQESQEKMYQRLQVETMKRDAAEMKLQDQLTKLHTGMSANLERLSNILDALQLQLIGGSKRKVITVEDSILGDPPPKFGFSSEVKGIDEEDDDGNLDDVGLVAEDAEDEVLGIQDNESLESKENVKKYWDEEFKEALSSNQAMEKLVEKIICTKDEANVVDEILYSTQEIDGKGKRILNTPLTVIVRKKGVPNVTMTYFPRINRVPIHIQSEDIYEQLSKIIMEYIAPEESIILNVLSMSVNFATDESIRISQLVNWVEKRTLAAVTKANKSLEGLLEMVTADDCTKFEDKNIDSNENFLLNEIKILEESRSVELPNFISKSAFSTLLAKIVKEIYVTPFDCAEKIWSYIETVVISILLQHYDNYAQLISRMEKLMDYTYDTEYTAARKKLMLDQNEFVKKRAYDLKMRMAAYWNIVSRRMVFNMVLHLLFNIQKLHNKEMQRDIINELTGIQDNGLERMLEDFRADNSKIKKTYEVDDQYRVDKRYQLGNSAYVKLQAYRLNSVSFIENPTLTFHCYVPYTILKKIGHVIYGFDLPLNSKVGRKIVSQFRICWEGENFDPASCEYEAFIRRRYSNLNPCGQGFLKGGGNVVDKVVEGLGKSSIMVEDLGKNFESTRNWEMWYRESSCPMSWEDLNIMEKTFPAFDPYGQGSQNGKGNVVNTTITAEIKRQQRGQTGRLMEVSEISTVRGKTHLQKFYL